MLYWGYDDYAAILVLVLSALSIYYSFEVTRVTKGAPRAWYFFICAFVVLFVYRAVQLYFDVQSPSDLIDDYEVTLSLLVGALLLAGLVALTRGFRRGLKTSPPS